MAPVKAYKSSLSQIELVTTYELLSALILEFVPILKFASLEKYYREDTFYRIIELFSTRFGFNFLSKSFIKLKSERFMRCHCFGIDDIKLLNKFDIVTRSSLYSSFIFYRSAFYRILQILFRTEFPGQTSGINIHNLTKLYV